MSSKEDFYKKYLDYLRRRKLRGKAYHVTSIENIPSILKEGLQPRRHGGFQHPEAKGPSRIYFCRDFEDLGSFLEALGYKGGSGRYAVLEVTLPKGVRRVSYEEDFGIVGDYFYSTRPIPPQNIRYLGEVRVDWPKVAFKPIGIVNLGSVVKGRETEREEIAGPERLDRTLETLEED